MAINITSTHHVSATADDYCIALRWTREAEDDPDFLMYAVYRAESPDPKAGQLIEYSHTGHFIDSPPIRGVVYYYWVLAVRVGLDLPHCPPPGTVAVAVEFATKGDNACKPPGEQLVIEAAQRLYRAFKEQEGYCWDDLGSEIEAVIDAVDNLLHSNPGAADIPSPTEMGSVGE